MRRFPPTLVLAAIALALLPLAGAASAHEHDGWGGRGGWAQAAEHDRGRGGQGWRGGERPPPPGWSHGGRQAMPPPPGAYYQGPPGYYPAPEPYGPPPGGYLRRGGHLPPGIRGEAVPDLGRYRLRPPPPGYAWVRVGNAFLLMNTQTGQIFDMIAD
jgi:Ni/Co efflux regulator RcnB